jgi:DNA-binding transcriptional LysR family regulator
VPLGHATSSSEIGGQRIEASGGINQLMIEMAERGLGLTYTFEPMVTEQLRAGRLKRVLEPYSATVPGFFIYFPSRAQRSGRCVCSSKQRRNSHDHA